MSDKQTHVIWRDMLTYLKNNHGQICRLWFEELEPLNLAGGVFEIYTRNHIQQNYLTQKCRDIFNEAAGHVTGALVMVKFVDDRSKTEREAPPLPEVSLSGVGVDEIKAGYKRPAPRVIQYDDSKTLLLSPDNTFENFVVGPGNQLAAAAAKAVADAPGEGYNPLFIHGGVGLGKTHLLQAICHRRLEENPDLNICYLSCDEFMNHFYESVQDGKLLEFRQMYRHVDMLFIDDIHFLTRRERTQEEFFHTFNTLYQLNKPIVLSSDSPPEEIPELEERLTSRFKWGLVAEVEKPCLDTRVAILKQKTKIRGIHIPDEVLQFTAQCIDSNTRELEGTINRMQGLAMVNKGEINMEIARKAVGDAANKLQVSHLTIQTIIDAVTGFYSVKLSDLQSKSRSRSISIPRQVCMYLARKRTRYSLEEIGGYFGGRDHTTVMHAIKSVNERITDDNQFAEQIGNLNKQLEG